MKVIFKIGRGMLAVIFIGCALLILVMAFSKQINRTLVPLKIQTIAGEVKSIVHLDNPQALNPNP